MTRLLAVIGMVMGLASVAARADTIADWTFETSQPSKSGSFAPEVGSGAASGSHASGSSVYSSPSGNGSAHSFSSNYWSSGDYYQFQVATTSLSGLSLTWDQISSSTGPKDFELEYSTNGTSFTNFQSYSVLSNGGSTTWSSTTPITASSYSFNLASVAALNNQASVYLRLVDLDTVSAGGGTVGTAGTDRVDNFAVMATAAPVPLPAGIWLLGSGIAAMGVVRRRRRMTV